MSKNDNMPEYQHGQITSGLEGTLLAHGKTRKAMRRAIAQMDRTTPRVPSGVMFDHVNPDARLKWLGYPCPSKPIAGPSVEELEYLRGVWLPATYHPGVLPPSFGDRAYALVQLKDSLRTLNGYRRGMIRLACREHGVPEQEIETAIGMSVASGKSIQIQERNGRWYLSVDGSDVAESVRRAEELARNPAV